MTTMIPRAMKAFIITVQCALFIASAASSTNAAPAAAAACPRQCECFTAANGMVQEANCTDIPDQVTTAAAWPQHVLRIRLDRASPVVLKNKAFKHFPRLTDLDVTGGTIRYVGRSAFGGLPELLDLGLVGTGVRKLHRDTFAGNRKLAFLSLKKNPGLVVGPSFLVSESITDLDLSACALKSLKSAYFEGLPNLKNLFASRNRLTVLGERFGPPGLKYADLGHNLIGYVADDLEAYKRLKTIDLTGNPINCTCELSEVDRKLASRSVAFGNTVECKNTGKPLDDMAEVCSDKEMMGDDPANNMYQAEGLLKVDEKSYRPRVDELQDSGSGSGDGGDFESTDPAATRSPDLIGKIGTDAENVKDNENTAANVLQQSTEKTAAESETAAPAKTEDAVQQRQSTVDTPTDEEPLDTVESSEDTDSGTGETASTEPQEHIDTNATGNGTAETVASTAKTGGDGDAVQTTARPAAGNASADTETVKKDAVPSGSDITYNQMKAPKDEPPRDGGAAEPSVTEYLKSNVGVAGTVALLVVVLAAIAYAATRLRRRRWSTSHDVARDDGKELKEIKYVAANADDDDRGEDGSAATDNLLADRDTDDDDDDDEHSGRSADPTQNGTLLSSVLDAVRDDRRPAASIPSPNGSPDVPTRVTVKLTETPKASKPVTINNVH